MQLVSFSCTSLALQNQHGFLERAVHLEFEEQRESSCSSTYCYIILGKLILNLSFLICKRGIIVDVL